MKVRRIDFSPDEWLAGAARLKADQRGCYITLIMMIYSNGEPILDDDKELSHICNLTVEKYRSIRKILIEKGKIYITADGRLSNRRCETELEKARNRTEKARENGEKGGKKSGISRQNPAQVFNNINDLIEPDASIRSEANHQPSTINQYNSDAAYAFAGQVIRLNQSDLDRWKATYAAIPDLAAELTGIDAWLAGQPESKRSRWFHSVPSMLSKKHQERLEKQPRPRRPRMQVSDMPEFQLNSEISDDHGP